MRRTLILTAAASMVAVAGCGGMSGQSSPSPQAGQNATSSPAARVAAAYTTTTQAKTAKLNFNQLTEIAGRRSGQLSGQGAVNFSTDATTMTLTTAGGGKFRVREIGDQLYLGPSAGAPSKLPAGKSWLSLNTTKTGSKNLGAYSKFKSGVVTNPTKMLDYLRGVSRVDINGNGEVGGVTTTRYTTTVNIDKLLPQLDPSGKKAMQSVKKQLDSNTFPMQIWVDDQGRIRKGEVKLRFTRQDQQASVTTTVTLSQFGTDVTISQPPEAKIATLAGLKQK